jgi:hypothetical protein
MPKLQAIFPVPERPSRLQLGVACPVNAPPWKIRLSLMFLKHLYRFRDAYGIGAETSFEWALSFPPESTAVVT